MTGNQSTRLWPTWLYLDLPGRCLNYSQQICHYSQTSIKTTHGKSLQCSLWTGGLRAQVKITQTENSSRWQKCICIIFEVFMVLPYRLSLVQVSLHIYIIYWYNEVYHSKLIEDILLPLLRPAPALKIISGESPATCFFEGSSMDMSNYEWHLRSQNSHQFFM